MITEPVRAALPEDADVARADVASCAFEKERAAAVHQINAIAIEIRAGDFFGATDANFVGAVHTATALAPVDEEIIKFSAMRQTGRFNFFLPRETHGRGIRICSQAR